MNKTYDHAYNIPLRVINNNPVKCLRHPVPNLVRVEFIGRGVDLMRLQFYDIVYEVDISDVQDKILINLTEHPEFVHFPEDIKVPVKSIIRPQQILFQLDDLREKVVPVTIKADIKTEQGFSLIESESLPDSIRIRGPASFVDTLSHIETKTKTFKDVNLSFSEEFEIETNYEFYADYLPGKVQVHFDVQRLAEKELNNVPVEVTNVPKQFEVVPLPSFVKLYIKGGERILANAEKEDFRVVINFDRNWQQNGNKIPATIHTDLNIMYVESRPAQFELIVQNK
jgi:YbbR domain-containing protein